jgi:hypothetical protein
MALIVTEEPRGNYYVKKTWSKKSCVIEPFKKLDMQIFWLSFPQPKVPWLTGGTVLFLKKRPLGWILAWHKTTTFISHLRFLLSDYSLLYLITCLCHWHWLDTDTSTETFTRHSPDWHWHCHWQWNFQEWGRMSCVVFSPILIYILTNCSDFRGLPVKTYFMLVHLLKIAWHHWVSNNIWMLCVGLQGSWVSTYGSSVSLLGSR